MSFVVPAAAKKPVVLTQIQCLDTLTNIFSNTGPVREGKNRIIETVKFEEAQFKVCKAIVTVRHWSTEQEGGYYIAATYYRDAKQLQVKQMDSFTFDRQGNFERSRVHLPVQGLSAGQGLLGENTDLRVQPKKPLEFYLDKLTLENRIPI